MFVNYHYIRDPAAYRHPGIHPISCEAFAEQIESLRRRYHVATPDEAEAYVRGEDALPGPSIFFTFDDGLVEHGAVAKEILEPLGIKAAFFIISRPLTEHRAVAVHKIHWLRATTDPERFSDEFFSLADVDFPAGMDDAEAAAAAMKTYPYDTPEVARVKYRINFQLPIELVDDVTSRMLSDRGIAESAFCRELYMDENAIRGLAECGHVIGSHGHSHRPLSAFDEAGLDDDIGTNLACLSAITGSRPTWISYPYGRDWSLPEDAEGFCRRHGFRVALTLLAGWNEGGESPSRLKRINTNEVAELAA